MLAGCFLSKHGCVVDLRKQVLLAGGRSVSLCSQTCDEQTASLCHVTFPETTVVPAYCQMQLPASASTKGWVHGDVILEPEGAFVEQHGMVVAHSLARSVEAKTVVQLFPSASDCAELGVLQPFAEVCVDVCAAKEASGDPPGQCN